jgi:hypothetical protein
MLFSRWEIVGRKDYYIHEKEMEEARLRAWKRATKN